MSKHKKCHPSVCEICNIKFMGTRKITRFCSQKCAIKSWYSRQTEDYRKNHFKINTINQRKKKRKYKLKAIKVLGGKCSNCGYKKCPAALDFHHTNSDEKDYTVKELMHLSWRRIEEEIKKCVLLCANCHREFHFNEQEQ